MFGGLVYCKRAIAAAEKAHPWRKQIYTNHSINHHLSCGPVAFSSSSSSRKSSSLHNYYIRKRRKWPIKKTQWHEIFASRLAKQSFKQSIRKTKTHLLTHLMSSFSAYEVNPTPESYHLLFKILIQNRPSNCHAQILQIFDHIEKVESFEMPECVFIDLIKFYGDVNMFDDAVGLFFRVPRFRCEPSVEVLNALLSVVCRDKRGLEMVPQILVKSCQVMGIRVEGSSFGILIKALCRIGSVGDAFELMNHMVEAGFCLDQRACSLMLATVCRDMNCDCGGVMGFMEDLKKLGFEPRKDDFCNVIRFLVKKGKGMNALELLKQMKVNGVKPDIMCYNLVLDGLIHNRDFWRGDKVFDELLVLGLSPDIYTYNVYISGLIMQKKVDDGINILRSMDELGCEPESSTYSTVLKALCEAGGMDRVTEVVIDMRRKCMRLNRQTYEILINGFIHNGDVNGAYTFLKEMRDKTFARQRTDFVRWFCKNGVCSKAVELFGEEVVKDILVNNPTSIR